MLITRETDYALRILRALAPGSCLTVGEIAEKESLPHKFTYKIMKKLEKAGIIRIIRGVNGGCQLDTDLHGVSLYDLVNAVEANARLAACMTADYQCEWRDKNGSPCNVHGQLAKVQLAIDREFRSRSLYFFKMQKWIKFVKYYCLEKGKKQQESQTIRHISAAQQAVNV